jgi:secondary thiamine-phosphate synthase enzyme
VSIEAVPSVSRPALSSAPCARSPYGPPDHHNGEGEAAMFARMPPAQLHSPSSTDRASPVSSALGAAMKILRHRIELATTAPIQIIDITEQVRGFVAGSGVTDGLVTVSCLHTTARINVNEREEKLERDMLTFLKRFAPRDGDYLHNLAPIDGRDNAHSHLIGLLMNSSETIPLAGAAMVLGQWQSIFFIELDGPRERRGVELQIIGQG